MIKENNFLYHIHKSTERVGSDELNDNHFHSDNKHAFKHFKTTPLCVIVECIHKVGRV